MLKVQEILVATNGKLLNGNLNDNVKNFKIDSRKIDKGDFYIPLLGEKVDGHEFIYDIANKGAIGFLKSENYKINIEKVLSINKNINIIEVKDTLKALDDMGVYNRKKHKNIEVVAITGSVGKTSTREMIASVLSQEKNIMVTQKNMNGHIGLPIMSLNMDNQDLAVLEAGIDFVGEMDILNKILLPDVAVITNIGTSHIGKLGSVENIYKEKTKIANGLIGKKILLLNKDDELLKNYKNNNVDIRYFSINDASDIKVEDNFIEFNTEIYNEKHHIKINAIGNHNILNAIVGIKLGEIYNLSVESIINGISSYRNFERRMEKIKLDKFTIIDDTYNASPSSTESGLISVNHLKSKRKIAVLADILELGDYAPNIHKNLGKIFKNLNYDIIIAFGENMSYLVDTAKEYVKEIYYYKDALEAEQKLRKIIKDGDIIYFKGSNAMKVFNIVENIKRDFSH